MERQTFINQMKARGYELETVGNGNINATKGDITVRLVPLADYIVYIDTPAVTAIIRKDATDAETVNIIAALTD
jgi:hypothetical protein